MNWFAHHSATRNRALPGSIFLQKNTRYCRTWYKSLMAFFVFLTRPFIAKPSFKRLCQYTDSKSRNKLYELIHGATSFPFFRIGFNANIHYIIRFLSDIKKILLKWPLFSILRTFLFVFDNLYAESLKCLRCRFKSL